MPVRWNTREVTQAIDEVEKLLAQAQVYLDEAKKRVEQASKIPHLPGYIDQRLVVLLFDIDRFAERARHSIAWVRKDIQVKDLKAQTASRSLFDV